MTKRLPPPERSASILAAALDAAEAGHYTSITRERVAELASCSPGLVSLYFGTMAAMRDAVMQEAVKRRNLTVVAQGIAHRDPLAIDAPLWLKAKALETLS